MGSTLSVQIYPVCVACFPSLYPPLWCEYVLSLGAEQIPPARCQEKQIARQSHVPLAIGGKLPVPLLTPQLRGMTTESALADAKIRQRQICQGGTPAKGRVADGQQIAVSSDADRVSD